MGHEQVPQPQLARPRLQVAHHLRLLVRVGGRRDLRVVDRLGGVDVLVHEHLQAGRQVARAGGGLEVHGIPLVSSVRWLRSERRRQPGVDEPLDGVGQAFLVGVVVAALEVPAQVVAHDRGHLVAAQGVEPGEVVDAAGRPRRTRSTSSSAVGSPATSRPTPGKLEPSAKTRNQPSSTRGSPTLQISQSISAAGSVPSADQVAEPVVAVHQRRRRPRPGRGPASRWCSRSASGTRSGGTAAIVRAQRASSSRGDSGVGVDRHLVEGYVVQGRQRSRRRGSIRAAASDGSHRGVVEHRLEGLAADQLHGEPGRLGRRRWRRSAGTGTSVGASAVDDPGLAQHVVPADRPSGLGGTDLTTSGALAGLDPVGQAGVAAGQPRESADLQAGPLAGAATAATRSAQPALVALGAHARGSRGRPSTRSARMLCWISSVPPAMR